MPRLRKPKELSEAASEIRVGPAHGDSAPGAGSALPAAFERFILLQGLSMRVVAPHSPETMH